MKLENPAHADLVAVSRRVREQILSLATDGGCFLGASLSCADILVFLYRRFLRFASLDDPHRDVFLLSKGHDVAALYATLAELGLLNRNRLKSHLKTTDVLYWHPNRGVAGVEFHSGSLGHLLSVGIGIALDIRLRRGHERVVVLLGDGELDEGSVWEALLVASAHRLENLLVVVDRNGFQANCPTEELVPLEPLEDKFRAFGFGVATADGHDFESLSRTFGDLPFATSRPNAVIAQTVRGKGIPSIEARADRWFCSFGPEELSALMEELRGGHTADVWSEPLLVR